MPRPGNNIIMTIQQQIGTLLSALPEARQRLILDFARFVAEEDQQEDWREFARVQFARAYGPDEPEYSEADLRPELNA
jgi:hypothetical protein